MRPATPTPQYPAPVLFAVRILLVAGLLLPRPGIGQTPEREEDPPVLRARDGTPIAAELQDLAWISGHWRAQALGGLCEEIWSEPVDGSMMGMFRLIGAGEVQFYELMTITGERDQVLLRIRHFSDRLSAWEEKDKPMVFRLLRLEPGIAFFDGLTLSREGEDGLLVQVRFDAGGPREEVVRFAYRRHVPGRD